MNVRRKVTLIVLAIGVMFGVGSRAADADTPGAVTLERDARDATRWYLRNFDTQDATVRLSVVSTADSASSVCTGPSRPIGGSLDDVCDPFAEPIATLGAGQEVVVRTTGAKAGDRLIVVAHIGATSAVLDTPIAGGVTTAKPAVDAVQRVQTDSVVRVPVTPACTRPRSGTRFAVSDVDDVHVRLACSAGDAHLLVTFQNARIGHTYRATIQPWSDDAKVLVTLGRTMPIAGFASLAAVAGLFGLVVQVYLGSRRSCMILGEAAAKTRMAAIDPTLVVDAGALGGTAGSLIDPRNAIRDGATDLEVRAAALARKAPFRLDEKLHDITKESLALRAAGDGWKTMRAEYAELVALPDPERSALSAVFTNLFAIVERARLAVLAKPKPTWPEVSAFNELGPAVRVALDHSSEAADINGLANEFAVLRDRVDSSSLAPGKKESWHEFIAETLRDYEHVLGQMGTVVDPAAIDVSISSMRPLIARRDQVRAAFPDRIVEFGPPDRTPATVPVIDVGKDVLRSWWFRTTRRAADGVIAFAVLVGALFAAYELLYHGKAFGTAHDIVVLVAWGLGGGLAGAAVTASIERMQHGSLDDLSEALGRFST